MGSGVAKNAPMIDRMVMPEINEISPKNMLVSSTLSVLVEK